MGFMKKLTKMGRTQLKDIRGFSGKLQVVDSYDLINGIFGALSDRTERIWIPPFDEVEENAIEEE